MSALHLNTLRVAARLIILASVGFGALTIATPVQHVYAQEAKMKSLLEGAMEDYDLVMLDEAEEKLEEAVALAASKGISGEPLAKVFVMLGIVRFARDRDEASTEQAFIAAIEAYPKIVLNPVYETPELAAIFEGARKKAKPPENVSDVPDVDGFQHTKLISAQGKQPLTIDVQVSENIPVFRMFVHHRRFGEESFQSTEMSPTSATAFAGTIPQDLVITSQLDYYIEALDRAGNVIAGVGSKDEPIEVLVRGGGDVTTDKGDGNGGGGGGDIDIDPVEPETPTEKDYVYLMLAGGSGLGFLPGGTPTARPVSGTEPRSVNPGVAATIGHAMVDLGWVINSSMRLGLYARWQFSPPQDFSLVPEEQKTGSFPSTREECLGLGLSGDCLLGLKYRYFFSNKDPKATRFYSSVGFGVGRVRHWVQLKENALLSNGQDNQECAGKTLANGQDSAGNNVQYCLVRDTVRTGWGHFGLGGGVTVPLGSVVEIVADTYLMFLTLDQTSINLDANVGLNFRF